MQRHAADCSLSLPLEEEVRFRARPRLLLASAMFFATVKENRGKRKYSKNKARNQFKSLNPGRLCHSTMPEAADGCC